MSFLGKKYKRTRHENLEEMLQTSNTPTDIVRILNRGAPIFCFTKVDDTTYNFSMEAESKHMTFNFVLGEEVEVERRDGRKAKVVYTMPRENVLDQVVKLPEGKLVYFSREFTDREAKMTVTMDETDVKATIYFEQIE